MSSRRGRHEVERDGGDAEPDDSSDEAAADGLGRLAARDLALDVRPLLERALQPIADVRARGIPHRAAPQTAAATAGSKGRCSSTPPRRTVTAVASGISCHTPGRSEKGSDTISRSSGLRR